MATTAEDASYIDFAPLLTPTFSPVQFANTLVLSTNNPSDTPLDLSTPLSRVLFDAQEINTHIDSLTTTSALPLLTHTREQTDTSARIVRDVEERVRGLNEGYIRLEKEVTERYEVAKEVGEASGRLWETVRLGRAVGRCLQLGRQLEVQLSEALGKSQSASGGKEREDHRALVRCADSIVSLKDLFARRAEGEEGYGLERVDVVRTLRTEVVSTAERTVVARSQQIIREFSLSTLSSGASTTTFVQTAEMKARTTSALLSLYLLSSPDSTSAKKEKEKEKEKEKWEPDLLVHELQEYLRTALTSSIASLARALATLPTLDRTLLEVSARCQNIIALEALLASTSPPSHTSHPTTSSHIQTNLLQPLLASLETGSLASYFWRTLASGLGTKVAEIVNKGGVSARTLRSNRTSVREAVRECVVRGCVPVGGTGKGVEGKWEREVAVMVGSVIGGLGR